MKAYWDDCGNGRVGDDAEHVDLREARLIWSDTVRGIAGNFLGLIDDLDRTIQFRFEAGIPDGVDDARHLPIVLMDLPEVERKGSYERIVTVGEVHDLIGIAFAKGADPRHFGDLTFTPW